MVGTEWKTVLLAWDVALFASTVLLVSVVGKSPISSAEALLLGAFLPLSLYIAGFYQVVLPAEGAATAQQLLLVALLLAGPLITANVVLPDHFGGLLAGMRHLAITLAVVWVTRLVISKLLRAKIRATPVVVIGAGTASRLAADAVLRAPQLSLRGVFTGLGEWIETGMLNEREAGVLAVIATGNRPSAQDARDRRLLRESGVEAIHLAALIEGVERRLPVSLLDVEEARKWFELAPDRNQVALRLKRVLDVIGAVGLLALLGPLATLGGIAMRVTSPGPILFKQRRVGLGGAVFDIYKLRSMQADAEASTGAVWSSLNDPRITGVGAFLRKTRLDEVPQLLNVLSGTMSLVGPRPERPEFTTILETEIPLFDIRHTVNPGLTGWAQVCYPYGSSVQDSERKLEYDLFYIKHWSIWFDVRVLLHTVRTVLLTRGGR